MKYLGILLVALVSVSAYAMEIGDAKPPTQQQLIQLISGNTIHGKWDGRSFSQHFASRGTTRYRQGSGATSRGTWRVNAAGQYCSIWPPSSTEACYDVLVKGGNLLWKSGDKVHPSEVESGDTF